MMTRPSCSLLLLLAATAFSISPALGQTLSLKRVLLSSGGVAYLEQVATVDGVATLPLSVRLDQVDDVLKSIVVYDETGRVGTVSLPGRQPLAQLFRDLPFDRAALSSPVRLLNALQGAEVEAVGVRTIRGRILRVVPETVRLPANTGTVTRHRLTLETGDGLQSLIVENAKSVRFVDPAIRAQIQRALGAVAEHRVQGRRTLEIGVVGSKRRNVRVGYVIAAPLWKATYRLTVGEGDRAYLQGWAVVENMSGIDWNDVDLTLVSGNPVTFRQALYESYYVERPLVPVTVAGRVLPRPDSGGVAAQSLFDRGRAASPGRRAERKQAMPVPMRSGLSAIGLARASGRTAPASPEAAASAEEAMSQVMFRFPGKVSVGTGRSAMLPIVSRDIPARQVALFQPDRQAVHPFAAVELTNDGDTTLPAGVVTNYRTGSGHGADYVGDAELRSLPAGERRLLSFAVDSTVRIDRKTASRTELVSAGLAGEGVLRQTYTHWRTSTYTIASQPNDTRDLLIEQRRDSDWTLEPLPPGTVTMLPDRYRLRIKLDPSGTTKFTAIEKRQSAELVRIGTLPLDRIEAFARDGRLDEGLRKTFAQIAVLQRALAAAKREVGRLVREHGEIVSDQDRLRKNLARVPANSDLHARYLGRLTQQEDRLDALKKQLDKARRGEEKARAALADYIARL